MLGHLPRSMVNIPLVLVNLGRIHKTDKVGLPGDALAKDQSNDLMFTVDGLVQGQYLPVKSERA